MSISLPRNSFIVLRRAGHAQQYDVIGAFQGLLNGLDPILAQGDVGVDKHLVADATQRIGEDPAQGAVPLPMPIADKDMGGLSVGRTEEAGSAVKLKMDAPRCARVMA